LSSSIDGRTVNTSGSQTWRPELVGLNVDVLVTHGTPGTRAAKRATTVIPIVMAVGGDAVGTGLVPSLARQGGNVTGSTFLASELSAKRLDLLKEAFPSVTRVGVLLNPDNPLNDPMLQAMEMAAKSLNVKIWRFEARGPSDLDGAFSTIAKTRVHAIMINQDPILVSNPKGIADLALKWRLPSIAFNEFAEAGGLIGYGVNVPEMFLRAAYFVDKILKGARPGDLPIEQPTKFELMINLKTAKTLALSIPASLLLRADQIIE
jgi:putative ABC transport system substrate-binding protein